MKMYNLAKSSVVAGLLLGLMACGSKVEIPPAYVGKILTKNGYAPETLSPSKFRLPPCLTYCDKLVLLEASDSGFKETMELFMPKDKLNLTVEIRGTLSIPTDRGTIDSIYDRIPARNVDGTTEIIRSGIIYATYGEQALRGVVRSELVKYTIGDILEKREAIGQSIHAAVAEKLLATKTPLVVSRFELADIQPPKVIVDAQQSAKEREIAVQRAEADAQVDLVKAEKELEIARKNRLVEKEKALAIAEQNNIAANSITPQLLAYRRLEVAENIMREAAASQNPGLIVIPADMSSFVNTSADAAILGKLLGKEVKK